MNLKKIIVTGILFFYAHVFTLAQNTLEYWVNNEYSSRNSVAVATGGLQNLNLPTGNQPGGLYQLNFRVKDAQGRYSPISSYHFLKLNHGTISGASALEYWFDGDFINRKEVIKGNELNYTVTQLSADDIEPGIHNVSFRAKINNGTYSAISKVVILKQQASASNLLEYWFDDNYALKREVRMGDEGNYSITTLNLTGIEAGFHRLNLRAKTKDGTYSAISQSYFMKVNQSGGSNVMEYWFDNNENTKQSYTLSSPNEMVSMDALSSGLRNGTHRITYRVGSSDGIFSAPMTDWFEKGTYYDTLRNEKQVITEYKYWTDDDIKTGATIKTRPATALNLNTNYFIPELVTEGKHLFNMQFKDNFGQWSLVASDSFNHVKIENRVHVEPKLYRIRPEVEVGNKQTFVGADFTPGGLVNLYIKDSRGDEVTIDASLFEYLEDGIFKYRMEVTESMPDGTYTVSATDGTTGKFSPEIKFKVYNPKNNLYYPLSVTAPVNGLNYFVHSTINISWADFVISSTIAGKTGLVPKFYKVEYSTDGELNWTVIKDSSYKKVFSHKVSSFSTQFSPSLPGNYFVRVTDLDEPKNSNKASFTVIEPQVIKPSLVWDFSTPNRQNEPIGVAADGTARIYVKLKRAANNVKTVKNVQAQLSPGQSGDNSSGTALLGKIMFANVVDKYSLEASTANNTSANKDFPTPTSNSVYFWYVAPDDFTHQRNNQEAERTVKATFNVTYEDNTLEKQEVDIIIVRPPLMLVHGLNGTDKTFKNAKYNVDGSVKHFMNDELIGNSLFKNTRVAVNLINYESYRTNAEILLGLRTTGISGRENFKYFIKQMNDEGFAANRVDYVCHSMGGDIARTVLSDEYKSYYRPSETSDNFFYKNYDSGFINKLITINTPHNGSPVADVVAAVFNEYMGPSLLEFLINSWGGEGFIQPNPDKITNKITPYIASNAILDLRQVLGGIRFNKTKVKNHLIGSSILQNILNTVEAKDFGNDEKIKLYSNLYALTLIGGAGIVTGGIGPVVVGSNYILSNSDGVVPLSSQFPGLTLSSIPDINDLTITEYNASIAYGGVGKFHSLITDDISVGTKVMQLLNSKINSTNFADEIAANPEAAGNFMRRNENEPTTLDSIKRYIDTNYVKIISPYSEVPLLVDSTVNFQIHLKDTNHLNKIQILFQGELYQSDSKVANQTFNFKVHSNSIGYNSFLVIAVYDSSGYRVDHMDTATYLVKSMDTLKGFYATPKSQILNSKHIFFPEYYAVYESYIGKLNEDTEGLSYSIADTNVVHKDVFGQFVTKDTGTTYIVFTYKGFSDTAFIYITMPPEYPDMEFSGKVFLQGAYNNSTSRMNNTLNTTGILKSHALSQPYNSATAGYSGYENISADYFDTHPDIVDWVLVELRDSTSPQTIVARRAALVRQDGTLVEANISGLDKIIFKDVPPGKYYVSIRHRNHLGIRSSSAIDFTESTGSYDFTTSASQSFQNKSYTSTVQVGNVWAMRAGDANGNGNTKFNGPANDQSHILNSKLNGSLSNILTNLYSPEDINMDGKIRWNGPANEQNYLLNTILLGSLTNIFAEQL